MAYRPGNVLLRRTENLRLRILPALTAYTRMELTSEDLINWVSFKFMPMKRRTGLDDAYGLNRRASDRAYRYTVLKLPCLNWVFMMPMSSNTRSRARSDILFSRICLLLPTVVFLTRDFTRVNFACQPKFIVSRFVWFDVWKISKNRKSDRALHPQWNGRKNAKNTRFHWGSPMSREN